jgi:lycopene cyclase domain-containing protein
MERFTYLALLLVWALPVIALHWAVGAPELRRHARLLVIAIGVPTVYLVTADAIAIGSGAWHISNELTLGLRWNGLVFEEALFFLLTNVMVAQSILLFLAPEPRRRVQGWLKRIGARRGRSGQGDAIAPTPPDKHLARSTVTTRNAQDS